MAKEIIILISAVLLILGSGAIFLKFRAMRPECMKCFVSAEKKIDDNRVKADNDDASDRQALDRFESKIGNELQKAVLTMTAIAGDVKLTKELMIKIESVFTKDVNDLKQKSDKNEDSIQSIKEDSAHFKGQTNSRLDNLNREMEQAQAKGDDNRDRINGRQNGRNKN